MALELGIPTICANEGHMQNLMMCFIEFPRCREKCFTLNFNQDGGLFDLPDYFQDELEVIDCAEFEEPVCAYTECIYCNPCKEILNDLYRCVIAHTTMIDARMKTMANCPLTCDGESFLMDSGDFVDILDGNMTDSNFTNSTDDEEERFLLLN
ncbi:MAG: hypothetical protein SGILL_007353 [Bacillariaceae sp.]